MKPRVLLTGGSGFLGQQVARTLVSAGAHVKALSRRTETDIVLASLGAEPVRGDVTDRAAVRLAMSGIDAVFHTAADTNIWGPRNDAQTRTNVNGTEILVSAAKSEGVRAFIHTSSVSAYSHMVRGTLREDVPQRGGESWINYERSKFLAEQVVRGSGLPFVIFQPSHILGAGDTHNWSRLIRLVARNELPGVPPGSGAFADVREVARAHVRGWQEAKFGETYLLGGRHASFIELITLIGTLLGRPTPRRATPAFLLKAYAHLVSVRSRVTGKIPDVTPETAALTCHDLMVDSRRAIAALDYREADLHSLLSDMIDWMRTEDMLG